MISPVGASRGHAASVPPPQAAAEAGEIIFPAGVPGFERCRRFVLVQPPAFAPLVCLNALDGPTPSFLAVAPHLVCDDHHIPLSAADRLRLDAAADEPLLWLALVHVGETAASVNLQAPIVINPRRMIGMQVVAADTTYSAHHPLPEY